jgi:hypothetical protein
MRLTLNTATMTVNVRIANSVSAGIIAISRLCDQLKVSGFEVSRILRM